MYVSPQNARQASVCARNRPSHPAARTDATSGLRASSESRNTRKKRTVPRGRSSVRRRPLSIVSARAAGASENTVTVPSIEFFSRSMENVTSPGLNVAVVLSGRRASVPVRRNT